MGRKRHEPVGAGRQQRGGVEAAAAPDDRVLQEWTPVVEHVVGAEQRRDIGVAAHCLRELPHHPDRLGLRRAQVLAERPDVHSSNSARAPSTSSGAKISDLLHARPTASNRFTVTVGRLNARPSLTPVTSKRMTATSGDNAYPLGDV